MVLTGSPTSTEHPRSSRRIRRLGAAVALPATLAGATLLSAPAALADVPAGPGSLTVHYSDGAVDWTVPTGTYQVSITAVGGSGADGGDYDSDGVPYGTGGLGGYGAVVRASLSVAPGQHLHLEPGSAGGLTTVGATFGGISTGPLAAGGSGAFGWEGARGGGGGAASVVRSDAAVLATAGGGGGGGGGSDVVGTSAGAGGNGGAAGAGALGGGAGGSGSVPAGTGPLGAGSPGTLDEDSVNSDGGGGGGGGGLDGLSNGGGVAGKSGTVTESVGDGGGGAGGPSFAVDPAATFDVASGPGDGWVRIDWTPGVPTTQTLSAPDSVDQGTAVTLTDALAAPRSGLPVPTGTVTFEQFDPATKARTVLGSVDVSNGQASLTTDLAGTGTQAIHAIYSGDGTYIPSVSDYVFATVVPTVTTLSVSPSPVAFANVPIGRVTTKSVVLTNTGALDWHLDLVRSDDPMVRFSSESCDALAAGASCIATVAFGPTATGPVTATLSVEGDTGSTSFTVTGTGVPARPVVTQVSPASGPRVGGTLVTITGRNFTGVTAIRIGSVAMTSVSCSSSTTCTAVTPRGTLGVKNIRVVTAAATSALVPADRFTYC